LLNDYIKIIEQLTKLGLYLIKTKIEIFNIFFQKIFENWYEIYKKDILDNKISKKIKIANKKIKLISRLFCLDTSH
jgi:hypothetical protein